MTLQLNNGIGVQTPMPGQSTKLIKIPNQDAYSACNLWLLKAAEKHASMKAYMASSELAGVHALCVFHADLSPTY